MRAVVRGIGWCTTLTLRMLIAYADNINNAWVNPASGGTPGTSGWVPIGRSDSAAFTAIFHGNGHTISNLYINSSFSYVGAFWVCGRLVARYVILVLNMAQ